MTIEMGGLSYAGHNMHGLRHNPIEGGLDYGVYRAVATHGQGLHGLSYGEPTMMDTVKSKLATAWDYVMANKIAFGIGAGLVLLYVYRDSLDLSKLIQSRSNPKRRKKRKQTAKQRAASLRNLKKARSKAGKRRGAKASASRKSRRRGGKRRVTAYQKLWGQYRKMGYSAKQAARMAKRPMKSAPKRSRSRSRSRSRR